MDRQRFNQLLLDPSKVENSDIRALNEYRKKYPYFQGLYVVVAKALKDREHPKTEAFIKKAAIYSANRPHLKAIIEGDDFFKAPQKEVSKTEPASKNTAQPKEEPVVKKEASTVKETKAKPAVNTKKVSAQPAESKVEAKKDEKKQPIATPKQKASKTADQESFGDDPILDELRATKARIEAMLRGETLASEPAEKEKGDKSKKKPVEKKTQRKAQSKRNDQIELIEKFIAEDPRIDIKKKAAEESDQDQVDLAEKSLSNSERFETETLAKLMIKQGKIKKAIQIYEKLSLKFPEKSTYFATQIQKVKSKHNV